MVDEEQFSDLEPEEMPRLFERQPMSFWSMVYQCADLLKEKPSKVVFAAVEEYYNARVAKKTPRASRWTHIRPEERKRILSDVAKARWHPEEKSNSK